MKKPLNRVPIVMLVALSACASSVEVTSSWQRPSYQPTGFKKVAVVALSGQKDMRRSVENFVVAELGTLHIEGVAVNDAFDELPTPDQTDLMRQRLRELQVDGAISLRLASRSFSEKSVPPVAADERYARDFFGTYQLFYGPVYGESSVDVETTLVIECALYALDGGGPVAVRELTMKKTKMIDQLRDGSSALVRSLNESGALTGAK